MHVSLKQGKMAIKTTQNNLAVYQMYSYQWKRGDIVSSSTNKYKKTLHY